MTSTVSLSRFVAITIILLGSLFLATRMSSAAPLLPVVIQPSTPIYVGSETQVRSGPLGILISNFLGGTNFEVFGGSEFEGGISILNNPIVINGSTKIGNSNGGTQKLDIVAGNLVVTDSGVVSGTNVHSPSNIEIESLRSPSLGTGTLCALQSGQLVRC